MEDNAGRKSKSRSTSPDAVVAAVLIPPSKPSTRETFKKMKKRGVGVDDADFYLQWAHLEASEGDAFEARNILAKAQERGEAVDHAKIKFSTTTLGEGAFGTVMKAEFKGQTVAVKTVRATKVSEKAVGDFRE